MLPSPALRAARERLVLAHVDAEARGDWAAALATFHHPRYELVATGEVHDGPAPVAAFYAESALAFPDLAFDTRSLHATDAGVVHEVVLRGTHRGWWRGLPPTGRTVRYAVANVFEFEEDRLVCERMYFDLLTPLRQLGIARDPTTMAGRVALAANHPLTVGAAFLRALVRGR